MAFIKILFKIIFFLIFLAFLVIAGFVIYIQGTKPAVPRFEQVRSDFSIIHQTKENFEWVALDEISPEVLTFFRSDKESMRPQSYWLQAIDSSFCQLPSRVLYNRPSRSKRENMAWELIRTFKIYYHLPIAMGTPARPITKLLHACTLSTDLLYQWDHQQLIEAYANMTSYGQNTYGIHAASQFYFNKLPAQLNMSEIVILLSLERSPTHLSKSPEELFQRSCQVLIGLDIPEPEKKLRGTQTLY